MKRLAGSAGILVALLLPIGAGDMAAAQGWTISLGAEGRMLPSYPGSDHYVFQPYPVIDIRRAGSPARFSAPRDGISIGLYEAGRFRAGIVGNVVRPRKDDDDDDLAGLNEVDWTVEIGGFAEYWPFDWLRTRAELRQGIGGHSGLVGDLTADVVVPFASQWTLSMGPRLTVATAKAMDPYFSITPAESAASGLAVYSAGGGIHSYGAGAQLRYRWTPQWEAHVFAEYQHLADDAAGSPLVKQRGSADQVTVGIGASYAFDIATAFDLPFMK